MNWNHRGIDRRSFLRLLSALAVGGVSGACSRQEQIPLIRVPDGQTVARFPEKTELILLTDRPPQLETPLFYFKDDLTANEAFFVRWHYAGIPASVNLENFTLDVVGHVDKTISLSVDDLRSQFEPTSVVAVLQCSGNSRSLFEPQVAGGQWQNGAMGNAKWTGVKLKDVLARAGVKKGAVQASFKGLDEAPLSSMPKFEKALDIEHALSDEILIAYEMNDKALPMLNGYPLRLVVPGWYATYWVKSLHRIEILPSRFEGFWMDKSYRIPKNQFAEETPENLAKDTVPINKMNVRSLIVSPDPSEVLKAGSKYEIEGIAFDGGAGINKIEICINNGTWTEAKIVSNDLGKYSWCRWRFPWEAGSSGSYNVQVRASNVAGETQQSTRHWNKSGYMFNAIDSTEIRVI